MAEMKIEKRCAWSDPIDPTLVNNPIQAMAEVVKKAVRSVPSCLPARILSYDRVSHTAIVQPLCNAMTNTGDSVERPPIKIHVIRFASGLHKVPDPTQPKGYRIVPGAMIDLPLSVGDTGWIIASDADTQAQKAANAHYLKDEDAGPLNPSTGLIHSFMHGVFIPDSFCSFPDIKRFDDELFIGTYDYDEDTGSSLLTPIVSDPYPDFKFDSGRNFIYNGWLTTIILNYDPYSYYKYSYSYSSYTQPNSGIYLKDLIISDSQLSQQGGCFVGLEIKYKIDYFNSAHTAGRFIPTVNWWANYQLGAGWRPIEPNTQPYILEDSYLRIPLYSVLKIDDNTYKITHDYRHKIPNPIPYIGPTPYMTRDRPFGF